MGLLVKQSAPLTHTIYLLIGWSITIYSGAGKSHVAWAARLQCGKKTMSEPPMPHKNTQFFFTWPGITQKMESC